VNLSSLSLQQTQEAGSIFINESRNIIILITSLSVINGELTLGMMLAIQYIIGLLNTPIIQVMDFIHDLQDVRISIERVNEIHQKKEENADRTQKNIINQDGSIHIENVSFQYGESASSIALKNVSLEIPRGKITAIVGTSGSGKTTLIKLLLGFFKPTIRRDIHRKRKLSQHRS
jgi:ATP-binding cassette subfamily B protein